MEKLTHPFYPVEANYLGYIANDLGVLELLGVFGIGCVVIAVLSFVSINSFNPRLPATERATVIWFAIGICALCT